jgi:hypothetical protein
MHEYGPVHAAEHREKFESCVIWGQSGYMERQCMESKGIEPYIPQIHERWLRGASGLHITVFLARN